jgi:hypothetical protein
MMLAPTYRWGIVPLLLLTGCGSGDGTSAPKTFSVTGTVFWRKGEPVRGGTIEFQPTTGAQRNSTAEIGDDGTFTLRTLHSGQKLPGAQPGPHRVTVIPASKEQTAQPILVPETYTIKADGNNEFVIILKQ